jgi:hypothetical protein
MSVNPGADPGFQVRGAHLKKIAPSGGRRKISWGISCEKSRFYAKKSYFFQNTKFQKPFLKISIDFITTKRDSYCVGIKTN